MPIYKYKCGNCATISEKSMSVAEMQEYERTQLVTATCPYCHGGMHRVFSGSLLKMDGRTLGTDFWDASIRGLNEQSNEAAAERKRKGDEVRREKGMERYNVEKNIH